MAVLTNFLKLLKPEKNNYVDVDKHISENYDKIDGKMQELNTSNSGKLDKGAVSSEYDTAKKIEDKIKNIINERWKIFTKSIQNGDNLNNITELGFYVNQQNTNNIINSPVSNTAFTLRVESVQPDKTQEYLTQILITYNTNDIYIRHKQEREWKEWKKIAKLEELTSSINELNSSKLDKGNVPEKYNTAEKIGNKIDGKVSKASGVLNIRKDYQCEIRFLDSKNIQTGSVGIINDVNNIENNYAYFNMFDGEVYKGIKIHGYQVFMNTPLSIDTNITNDIISIRKNGELVGVFGANENKMFLYNDKSKSELAIMNDGTVKLYSQNLQTTNKDIPLAINELNSKLNYEWLGGLWEIGNKVPVGNYSSYIILVDTGGEAIITTFVLPKSFINDKNVAKQFIAPPSSANAKAEAEFIIRDGYFELTNKGELNDCIVHIWANRG